MEKCQQIRKWIWLTVYNELPVNQQKILEEHIKDCPECQLDYEEAMKTINLFDQKVQLEPTDVQLKTNRAELHQRLLLITQPGFQKNHSEPFGDTRGDDGVGCGQVVFECKAAIFT